jgi:hypothetical protein
MKSHRSRGAVVILFGAIALAALTRSPRFGTLHAVDVLQLLASGVCFGIGITLIVSPRLRQDP